MFSCHGMIGSEEEERLISCIAKVQNWHSVQNETVGYAVASDAELDNFFEVGHQQIKDHVILVIQRELVSCYGGDQGGQPVSVKPVYAVVAALSRMHILSLCHHMLQTIVQALDKQGVLATLKV